MKHTLTFDDVAGHIRCADKVSILLGAGASKSAGIPLAGELVSIIHKRYPQCLSPLPQKKHRDYGAVMGKLSPAERKQLLNPYLDTTTLSLNWGHVALAHMVRHTAISRILSCNFDSLLEHALSLLNDHMPIYDFGISPTSYLGDLAEKAIFHLHGQGYGLRMLNGKKETKKHAKALRPLLKDSLHSSLTLVIGYSGEADAIFKIIKKEYHDYNRLIWLGYSEKVPKHLRSFFKKHPYAHYIGNCSFDETMFTLAQKVGANWPPTFLSDPLNHIVDSLGKLPKHPLPSTLKNQSFDLLNCMKTRLQTTQHEWENNSQYKEDDKLIHRMLSDEHITEGNHTAHSSPMRQMALQGYKEMQESLKLPLPKRVEQFNKAEAIFHSALDIKEDETAFVYIIWGLSLDLYATKLTNKNDSLNILRKAEEKFHQATEIDSEIALIFGSWGVILRKIAILLPGTDEKIATLQNAEDKFNKAIKLQPKGSTFFGNWGVTLLQKAALLSDTDEKITTFQNAEDKFNKATKLDPKNYVNFRNWGVTLCDKANILSDTGEKITTLQNAEDKFNKATKLSPKDASSFRNWGVTLCQKAILLSNTDEQITTLQNAEDKFSNATTLAPKNYADFENWGVALLQKALLTSNANEKLATLQNVEEKLRQAIDINPKADMTFVSWGMALLQKANILSDTDEKITALQNAKEKFSETIKLDPTNDAVHQFLEYCRQELTKLLDNNEN